MGFGIIQIAYWYSKSLSFLQVHLENTTAKVQDKYTTKAQINFSFLSKSTLSGTNATIYDLFIHFNSAKPQITNSAFKFITL